MTGRVLRWNRVTRADLRANPDTYFVFGDNLARRGLGGQAKEMRGEPNAIGVPTKHGPYMTSEAYFIDSDLDNAQVRGAINEAFDSIEIALAHGHDVVIPTAGLGTGLAQLPQRAPRIHAYIDAHIKRLEDR
jgi:hypothetical protein